MKPKEYKSRICAAEQGSAEAQYQLGLDYEKDYNLSIAFFWLEKAALQGHSTAQYKLGQKYFNGLGVEQNYEEAGKWYKRSAKQGCREAQYELYCYLLFSYNRIDKGFKWLSLAAEQGHAMSQYWLGVHYQTGVDDVVSIDYKKALYWFVRAFHNGHDTTDEIKKIYGENPELIGYYKIYKD